MGAARASKAATGAATGAAKAAAAASANTAGSATSAGSATTAGSAASASPEAVGTPEAPEIFLYADGACSGNPGPGGWAVVLVDKGTGTRREMSGADPQTTNNRMEMRAVIEGLGSLSHPTRVRVTTDSRYVVDGMREWLPRWVRNGWRTADRKPVKNQELWEELARLEKLHQVEFEWIRGHDGHAENERCDELAVAAYRKIMR